MKSILKALAASISRAVPRTVPTTDTGLLNLVEAVLAIVDVPSNPSTRQAVAVMIQGLLRERQRFLGYRVSINRIAEELRRGMANQAAFNLIQAAREEQKDVSGPQV